MQKFIVPLLYQLIVRPWFKFVIGVSFENRAVFKDLKKFILVANHNSHFDAVSILAALPPELFLSTYVITAGDYFGSTRLKAWTTSFFVHGILIRREKGNGNESAISVLDKILKSGNSLIIFPEGTRGKPGIISDFKSGVAVLLHQNIGVPFIPVYLDGFGRVLPKDSWLIVPLNCKVRFGKAIYPQGEKIEEILELVKKAILDLKSQDERDGNQFAYE